MAIRKIVIEGNDILAKVCRPVENFDSKLWQLLDDMKDTMYEASGVGLAAPQVGILRRAIVIDTYDGNGIIEAINPEIVESSGEQKEQEGCLSCPGDYGTTLRPMNVKVKAQDRFGNVIEFSESGLKARAFCHEIDHLNGILFKSRLISGNIKYK